MRSKLIIYPEFCSRIERDYMYTVSVTDSERTVSLPVYNHTEDSGVCRNALDEVADEYRRFSSFAFDGEGVRVDIKVNRDFNTYSVLPTAKHFKHEFCDGVISVYLDKPEYFLIRLDDKDNSIIAILADYPETEVPEVGENTYIIDGWHERENGVWNITEPNTTIYIKAGAVLNTRIHIMADNCKIFGRGAVVDPCGNLIDYDISKCGNDCGIVILIDKVSGTVIDGIHMLDARAFNIYASGKWMTNKRITGTRISNVKMLSSQMCTDGISMNFSMEDAIAERCFIYNGDNAIVYGSYTTYRDITIGTTCNAIFPQGDMEGCVADGIYVFRADEGIINDDYMMTDDNTTIRDSVIRNLYADDVTYAPYFLALYVPTKCPVTSLGSALTVENAHIRKPSDLRMHHFYHNVTEKGDYAVNLKNIYVGGKLMSELNEESVGSRLEYKSNTLSFVADSEQKTAACGTLNTVNYVCPDKVFFGKYQVYFAEPVIVEGDKVFFPYNELMSYINVGENVSTETRSGVQYVCSDELMDKGIISAVKNSSDAIMVTLCNSEKNLLVADKGIISRYVEYVCYRQHLTAYYDGEDIIYKSMRHNKVETEMGIHRVVNDTLKMYGTGVYTLSFDARNSGQTPVNLFSTLRYGSDSTMTHEATEHFDVTAEWTHCCMDFEVKEELLTKTNLALVIYDFTDSSQEFEVKNINLTKK